MLPPPELLEWLLPDDWADDELPWGDKFSVSPLLLEDDASRLLP